VVSRFDERLRRVLDSAGVGLVVAWPALCAVIAVGVWIFGG
jgi:hypothetical protein